MTRTLTRRATPVMTMIAVPRKEKKRNLRSSQKVRAMRTVTTAPTPKGLVIRACPVIAPPPPIFSPSPYEGILGDRRTGSQDRHAVMISGTAGYLADQHPGYRGVQQVGQGAHDEQ